MKTYLAILKADTVLDAEVREYLGTKNIEVTDHYKNLGILKLQCSDALVLEDMDYIQYLELENNMHAMTGSESGLNISLKSFIYSLLGHKRQH